MSINNCSECNIYIDKISSLKSKVKLYEIHIMELQMKIKCDELKNNIYKNIIENYSDIQLDRIIEEQGRGIHIDLSHSDDGILDKTRNDISIVIKDQLSDIQTYKFDVSKIAKATKSRARSVKASRKKKAVVEQVVIDDNRLVLEDSCMPIDQGEVAPSEVEEKPKLPKYRTVKKFIKVSEKELEDKLKEDAEKAEKVIDKLVYDNFDVSRKDVSDILDKLFDQIATNRTYTTALISIQKERRKLLGKLDLTEYKNLLISHIKRLDDIFTEKKYHRSKIEKTISKSMTPLDLRLTHYEGYTNVIIDPDEVYKFGLALDVIIDHKKQFIQYNRNTFFENIKNYGLALFDLHDCIERCLINRYGFHNLVYLPKETDKKASDPYSFYTLEKISSGKRCWKMECRLDDFTHDFIDNILPYCIALFRRIYKDIFSDNVYRDDYISKSQIAEYDCEQLLQNIITLSKPMKLCKMVQTIIIKKCAFSATESDKFNLHGDDKMQQKKFNTSLDSENDIIKTIKSLFDGIYTEQAEAIINK